MKKFWKTNKKAIKFVFLAFILWQVAIIIISLLSPKILLKRERFIYNDGEKIVNPVFLWDRANFDGAHYLLIARNGYGLNQQAFFPLYPKIIKYLTPLFGGKDLLAGVFISNICFLLLLFIFYKLIKLDHNDKIARRVLLLLIFFPASFFFGMVYTESLFLFLILASFYAARMNKWVLAGLLGMFASYTRIVGVFLFPALIYEWWVSRKHEDLRVEIKKLVPIFLVPLGLLNYMRFLWIKFQDPLMFIHVQSGFGAGRSSEKIILLYQVFWRYLKMILTTRLDVLYYSVWLELLVAVVFLILLFLAYKKGIRKSYLVFAVLAYFIPTLSGTFLSMPRFVLVLFPCFIYLGGITNKILHRVLFIIFCLLFIISAVLFFRGYWIS